MTMTVATGAQVVRWRRKPGGRWSYGRWSGERGGDGSLTVTETRTETEARLNLRGPGERARSLRAELVEVAGRGPRGKHIWSPLVEPLVGSSDTEPLVGLASASPEVVTSRDGDVVDPLVWSLRQLVAFASVMTWSGHHADFVGTVSGSEVVAALEAARDGVRRAFPELLDAVMITGSGLSARGVTWGHFRREAWRDALASGRRPEIFIGAERLATGAVLTMQTILHEAAHELAFVREIQDTSRQHRYHNGEFRKIAEELGLTYTFESPDPTIGYSAVTLTAAGKRRWSAEIAALHQAITLMGDDPTRWLLAPGGGGAGLGGHGVSLPKMPGQPRRGGASYVRLTCACPFTIRAAATTVAATTIRCDSCGEEFTP